MLGEFNGIVNQTLGERIDKSTVEKNIKAKVHFGLGHPIKTKNLNVLMSVQSNCTNQSLEHFKGE